MSDLRSRYDAIRARMDAAARTAIRDPSEITLVAVSKKQPVDLIEELYRLGHRDFGENYVQELVEKAQELKSRGCDEIRWHLIGHLQTNKVKAVLPWVHAIHSVDSEKLAREIDKRWGNAERSGKLPIFLEVNIDREPSKSGLDRDQVPAVARVVAELPSLQLEGLMCVPSSENDEAALRSRFQELRELGLTCCGASSGFLSMGMSGDFEIAIAEGSTHIRVGTAIFGSRH